MEEKGKKLSRRQFGHYGLMTIGAFVVSLGAVKIDIEQGFNLGKTKLRFGVSEAGAACGTALECAGGGGQCGTALECAGGGGQCGTALNCAGSGREDGGGRRRGYGGGGGMCGTALSCAGGGGQCGTALACAGGGGVCGTALNCSGR